MSTASVADLFASGLDLARLERLLLERTVATDGLAFPNVALLCWNPQRGVIEGRWWWGDAARGGEERAAAESPESERTRALRRVALVPERLPDSLAHAWAGAVTVTSREEALAASGDLLTGDAFLAIGLRSADGPFGLLIAGGTAGCTSELGLAHAEMFRRLAEAALSTQARGLDLKRRERHMAAVCEYAQTGISDLNLAEVLNRLGRLATEATVARGGAVWLTGANGALKLEATAGPAGTRERVARGLAPLAEAAMADARPISLDRATDDARLAPESAAQLSAVAVVPVRSGHRAWGALAVYDRAMFHPTESPAFGPADLEFLRTLADQTGLMLEHAARLDELKRASRRRDDLQAELGRSERLAALGESMAKVAQEIRNPLASIAAFAKRAHRGIGEDDPQREYLEIVIREAERLERTVGEQLQAAQPRPNQLKLESLNAVVQEALQQGGEKLVRRRVRLLKKLSPDVPPLLLDAARIGRVVANILDHALESVAPGGRVRVESRRVQEYVVVEIAHDGVQPGDLLEQLFVPFTTGRAGQSVGLSLAQQIVREHGGEIRVRSESEWSSIFSFTLPVPINQDRRATGRDRRSRRDDRRKRPPAA